MELDMKSHVLSGCRVLLRPVVRLLLKSGITWREFADVAKSVFVDVATREFGIRGRPTNTSRVAILTGINRHDVAKQRELLANSDSAAIPAYTGSATRVLSGWHQDPDYLDGRGEPVPIAVEGPAPSFEDLCGRYAGDIPATALLKELKSVGAVEGQGIRLFVRARNYIPLRFDAEKMTIGAQLLHDHAATVVYDLTRGNGEPARLARRAHNARIDARAVPAFREFIELEGQAFLERVDDWLTTHEAPADSQERALIRLGAGVYQIQDERERGART